jgi:hypothetical protein
VGGGLLLYYVLKDEDQEVIVKEETEIVVMEPGKGTTNPGTSPRSTAPAAGPGKSFGFTISF